MNLVILRESRRDNIQRDADVFKGAQTPKFDGGLTPHNIGGMTPMVPKEASQTPSANIWSAITPAHLQNNESNTFSDDEEDLIVNHHTTNTTTQNNNNLPYAIGTLVYINQEEYVLAEYQQNNVYKVQHVQNNTIISSNINEMTIMTPSVGDVVIITSGPYQGIIGDLLGTDTVKDNKIECIIQVQHKDQVQEADLIHVAKYYNPTTTF